MIQVAHASGVKSEVSDPQREEHSNGAREFLTLDTYAGENHPKKLTFCQWQGWLCEEAVVLATQFV